MGACRGAFNAVSLAVSGYVGGRAPHPAPGVRNWLFATYESRRGRRGDVR